MFRNLILLAALLISSEALAQTWLPAFFSNQMVLQQNEEVSIWGKDDPRTSVTVTGSWGAEASVKADKNGKWALKLQTAPAGGPYTVTVEGSEKIVLEDILLGEVWFCSGQSNMEMPLKGFNNQPISGSNDFILNAKNDQLRLFTAKRNYSMEPLDDVEGSWSSATPATVREFSATAYFFGKQLQEITGVPVGLMHSSWGGSKAEAWMDPEALSAFPEIAPPEELPENRFNHTPTLLYNAMLHPFIGYTMKGAIWYQGESNRNDAKQYETLFPALINSWRAQWQQGAFPFYFVQIAPYRYDGENESSSAFLREAQLNSMLNTENTGMVVTMDIGDCDCIHPAEKNLVGKRLAYWALANDYGIEGINFQGPVFEKMEVTVDGEATLFFDHLDLGLTFYDNEPAGFEIAGEDKIFHPAHAKINRDKTLTVWSDFVTAPVAVRYAFKNCSEGTLFNTAGLPASSFRTDDWGPSK
jgi:sialate O-acetylesterase